MHKDLKRLKMDLLDKIKKIASEQGLSLREVNDKAGLGTRSIYHWKNQTPSIEKVTAVANVLHVPVSELIDDNRQSLGSKLNDFHQKNMEALQRHKDRMSQLLSIEPSGNTNPDNESNPDDIDDIAEFGPHTYHVRIPVLGRIACGEPILAEQNIEGYRDLSFSHKPDGDMFILRCHGKSMEPTLRDNSFITIRVQPSVENGEMAAILIGDEATIKRVYYKKDEIILKPDNPNYGYIKLNKENPGKILGKVVHMDVDF